MDSNFSHFLLETIHDMKSSLQTTVLWLGVD